jgi:hypothetical protein
MGDWLRASLLAFDHARAKPMSEFASRDVSHRRQSSTSLGSNSITCPASANDNFARRKGASF